MSEKRRKPLIWVFRLNVGVNFRRIGNRDLRFVFVPMNFTGAMAERHVPRIWSYNECSERH
jgi:hypothetical protein